MSNFRVWNVRIQCNLKSLDSLQWIFHVKFTYKIDFWCFQISIVKIELSEILWRKCEKKLWKNSSFRHDISSKTLEIDCGIVPPKKVKWKRWFFAEFLLKSSEKIVCSWLVASFLLEKWREKWWFLTRFLLRNSEKMCLFDWISSQELWKLIEAPFTRRKWREIVRHLYLFGGLI